MNEMGLLAGGVQPAANGEDSFFNITFKWVWVIE